MTPTGFQVIMSAIMKVTVYSLEQCPADDKIPAQILFPKKLVQKWKEKLP